VLGIIGSCRAREAILQPAELAELVSRDQINPSVRAVDRGLSILLSGGKETKKDVLSSGE